MEALTLGQVGFGPWGSNLARNFNELARLKWICDVDAEAGARLGSRFPATTLTHRIDDLLADDELDAVVVATPVPTHAEIARAALLAGKHVFVEKPMALDPEDAEVLVELAAERDLTLMPGHLLLYHPGVARLKELVDSGSLGEVLYVYGNRQNLGTIRKDENALWSLGVHDLSVILHLLGEDPVEVWSRAEVVVRIEYGTVDAMFREFTRDINEGGVFVATSEPLALEERVELQFRLPGSEDGIEAIGRVIRVDDGSDGGEAGMAIEFEELDREARASIDQLVRSLRSRD